MVTSLIPCSQPDALAREPEPAPGYREVEAFLNQLGARKYGHARARSLCDHLLHTRQILAQWSYPVWIQNAGALHSIYGTETDKKSLVPLNQRDTVQAFAGNSTERSIFLFCTVPRQAFLAALAQPKTTLGPANVCELLSSVGHRQESVNQRDLDALISIHMANYAEQAQAPDGGPGIWLDRLNGMARQLSGSTPPPAFLKAEAPLPSREQEEEARTWYVHGLDALKKSKYGEAANGFRTSSRFCSVWAEPTIWRAYLALQEGDFDAARQLSRLAQQQLLTVGVPWDKKLKDREWLWLSCALGRLAREPQRAISDGFARRFHSLTLRFGALDFPDHARRLSMPAKGMPPPLASPPAQPNAAEPLDARFQEYIGSFARNSKNAKMFHYPSLPSQPFFPPETFPLAIDLEANFQQIREEILAIDDVSFHEESEASIKRSGSWEVFMLYERGRKNQMNAEMCPTMTRIIERHNTVKTLAGLIYVSKMSPHSVIRPHHGPTNMRLRCHLGVQIPPGDCAIRVKDQVRCWEEGKCLIFDDFYEHEAWNRTDGLRKVLIVDVWHPGLSENERLLLEGLHRFAMAQTESLNKYWSGNEKARKANYD
jgi:aspartyl/asparaginyl beta-hydroxylase (cupin superfamily)